MLFRLETNYEQEPKPEIVAVTIKEKTKKENDTLLINRTLRSGQSIQYDGNVVVLGDVNPGAEIISGGHVVVMGVLRGVVHAGASGDTNCVVMALKLLPIQLRIANHITRAPDNGITNPGQPEIAKIKDDMVTIEILKS